MSRGDRGLPAAFAGLQLLTMAAIGIDVPSDHVAGRWGEAFGTLRRLFRLMAGLLLAIVDEGARGKICRLRCCSSRLRDYRLPGGRRDRPHICRII